MAAAITLALLVAVGTLILAACGGLGSNAAHTASVAVVRHSPHARLHASAPRAATQSAQLKRLQAKLSITLRREGPGTGAIVRDLSDNTVLYSLRSSSPKPPASLEKLYTSVAATDLLGAGARLPTTVLGVGTLGAGGVWHGDLYLRGSGDPTFGDGNWNRLYMGGYGPTATQLVSALHRDGIRRVTGWVYGDDSLFDSDPGGPATHYRPDIPDYGGEMGALVYDHGMTARGMPPAVFAAHELVLTMRTQNIDARSARRVQIPPSGARTLATVDSPPLSRLLRLMNVPSDDMIADLLTKQLGAGFGGQGTLIAGAAQISRLLAQRYDLRPTIDDGSGLDRADSTTPTELVSLLAQVWGQAVGQTLYASLPVLGREGTVRNLGDGSYAVGHCVAKTGTLDDVTNLAGYCSTRTHQTLAFALMIDGPANGQALMAISHAVAAIASY